MGKNLWIISILLLISSPVFASQCPEWLMKRSDKNIPVCPQEGSPLPDTYPVGAVVVSDNGYDGWDSAFTIDTTIKILTGAGENTPLVVLPVRDITMEILRSKIDALDISPAEKKRFHASLLHVNTKPYTWQQDYMQSYVNPKSGEVQLRRLQGYDRQGESFEDISAAIKNCGFATGAPLVSEMIDGGSSRSNVKTEPVPTSGAYGGNIEGLPGGICLLGDSFSSGEEWTKYANQVCDKDPKNRIKVPTDWLMVGHTDEVIKIIRNKQNKSPCDFSISIASPRKALELLKNDKNGKFLNFQTSDAPEIGESRIVSHQGLFELCRLTRNYREGIEAQPPAQKESQSISSLFDFGFLGQANADTNKSKVNPDIHKKSDPRAKKRYNKPTRKKMVFNPPPKPKCEDILNGEVYELMTIDEEYRVFNELVQEKMDSLKNEVVGKLKNKFPKCEIDVLEVPNLFYGGSPVEFAEDKYTLPLRFGNSILPNPTNAVSINDTLLSPDPGNDTFKKYLDEEYKKRGLKSEHVDTFDYAHKGRGNLHCATNAIYVCRPGAKK